jgi:hypothetical protein
MVKRILKKYGVSVWTGYIWLWAGNSGPGPCEKGSEASGSVNGGEFLD